MLFDKIYDSGRKFSANTIAFLDGWRRIAVAPIVLDHPVSTLALNSMERSEFMEFLVDQVSKSLPEVHHYTSDRYSKDIGNLVPLADASIPPIEWLSPTEGFQQADPVAVLNVGWECFLGGLGKYGKALRSDDDIPDFKVSQRFNALVMKSLELIEIRKTWEEANAFVGGPNPQSDS